MSDTPELSRRSFVTKASLGAAAAGALVLASPLAGRADAATPQKVQPADRKVTAIPAPVVAQVVDVASGTVEIFSGERSTTVVDHALAQSLARAAGH